MTSTGEPVLRDWKAFVSAKEGGALHIDLAVEGIHCAACMGRIERGLATVPGIRRARVNLTTRRLGVDWVPTQTDPQIIIDSVRALGYEAHPFDPGRQDDIDEIETRRLLRYLAVAGFAAMNVMLLSVSVWSGNVSDITPETRLLFHWLSALVALPAAVYAGQPFYTNAWRALRSRSLNMDVPITVGVTLALALSLFQTVSHAENTYYDSAIMLLFFLLAGRALDRNMRRRTRSFAENIAALRAETASKLLPDGSAREVPVSRIDPGDRVMARPGELIAVDGVVEEGRGRIDQSLITGETDLAPIEPGSRVYAGTLNMEGLLVIRVTAAGQGTLLDEVNRLLENAAQDRSRYVRLADRAAQYYAPLVHAAAGLTLVTWMLLGSSWQAAIVTAISVLIITCPCALGLAIPAVQVVASGLLFRFKVLPNGADFIERLAQVDTIVFDKTGTLTLPQPAKVEFGAIGRQGQEMAGRLALSSHHPLAFALATASGAQFPLPGAVEVAGQGVEADFDGRRVRLGSPDFCGVGDDLVRKFLAHRAGSSVIAMRQAEDPPHLFCVRQAIRSDAGETVEELRRAGYAIEILSGDRPAAVGVVAQALGIDTWRASMNPTDKIDRLTALAESGARVLMIGDGLNDAPALAAAHVSLSPITAVHLSQAAADAVFLGERLAPVAHALAISRTARRAMIQNLMLAALYNIVAVPFAMAGFVTPLIAALAMSGSSLAVTANALRLKISRAVPDHAD